MAISEALKRVYASAPNDDHYIETLSLEHPAFEDGVRFITNNNGGWVGDLETGGQIAYDYAPFVTAPPSSADQGNITLSVAIDNASRGLMDQLERMSSVQAEPIKLVYRVYLASSTALQNDPPLKLEVLSVTATQYAVSFSASMTNLRNKPFPAVLYTVEQFPGLER